MKLVRRQHCWSIILHTGLTISLLLLTSQVVVLAQVDGLQAKVHYVTGRATLINNKIRPGDIPITKKDQIQWGSTIKTGNDGRVVIRLSDESLITVFPNSEVELNNNPAASSPRELLEIKFGRVLVKIHHIWGKPNPCSLSSPSASIAVRGTEFIVDVLQNGETSVSVLEGQVEVWPRGNPGNKRLVTPGGRVIVRPGGDISLAFPGPGGQLNPRNRVNQNLEGAYQRSVDSLVQNSISTLPSVFTAFPDSHVDSLENPAYAAEFKDAEGRLSMLPSVSKPYIVSDENHQWDYTVTPQLTFYTPIPGSRFSVGGSVSGLRTKSQILTELKGSNYSYYSNNELRFDASNLSLTAAYSFGADGRTSVGVGIDRLTGTGSFLSDYRSKSEDYSSANLSNSDVRFTRTRLTLGVLHKFSESKKLGLYYRQGFTSSKSGGHYHRDSTGFEYPEYNISVPPYDETLSDNTNISTLSSEVGIRYRAQMTRRLFYGFEGSYLYERINTRYRIEDRPLTRDRDLARRARLGVGTGFILNSRTIISLDFTGGHLNTSKPATDNYSYYSSIFNSDIPIPVYNPVHEQGNFLSGHGMIQMNPWRNLFVSASSLTTFYKGLITYTYTDQSFGRSDTSSIKEKNYLTNFGVGWRFASNLIGEYQLALDHTNRRPSHSIMLRYTFNLNIKGER
jgi:FecR-like protein